MLARLVLADNSGAAQLFIRKESDLPGGDFDLQYSSIVFQAGGGACRAPASQLAVDPTGGALLELNSDDTTEIEFDDGFEFPFFGKNYDSAFVASNGFGKPALLYHRTVIPCLLPTSGPTQRVIRQQREYK